MKKSLAFIFLLMLTSLLPLRPAQAQGEVYCAGVHQDVAIPLTDLGPAEYIRMDGQHTGFTGGLYPGGLNQRPSAHQAQGLAQASLVQPLDADGNPDPQNGLVAMISIGMSNAYMEFQEFMAQTHGFPGLNPYLFIENGAQAGQVAQYWADPNGNPWTVLALNLANHHISPLQVQVAWIKEVRTGAGAFPAKPLQLQADLQAIVQNLKDKYPNTRLAYLTSRTRAYIYVPSLSPEPAAYESGFAVKWLIESQINGNPALNFNPAAGPVQAPWLSWGPYLWADGLNPRSDGLIWTPQDLLQDCTHPSSNGEAKAADMLLDFFSTDPTSVPWFMDSQPLPQDFSIFLPLARDDG
jgi:hypothetical protein